MAKTPKLESLEDELKLQRDIVNELENIVSLSRDAARARKAGLDSIKKSLDSQLLSDKLTQKEYDVRLKSLDIEEEILKKRISGKPQEEATLKNFINTNKELSKIVSSNKKFSIDNLLTEAGLGRFVEMKNMIEEASVATDFFYTTILGTIIYVKELRKDFQEIDKAAASFRKSMGFLRDDSKSLEETARKITFDFAHVGVTAEDVYKSMSAISLAIGTTEGITERMAGDMTLLSVQLGVAESTSADFLKTMGMVGKTTMDAQSDMALFTARLSAAAGTNLNEVMMDVASAAKTGYQFLSRDPLALAKAAVEARRMGTSLESATKTSGNLLQFTESVKAEMEASVLIGKSINLQKARELAYHRDIEGLNKEILNIMNQTNFESLDPFQQQAVATALGKSTDELAKMAQAARERASWEHSSDKDIQKQYANYQKLMAVNKATIGDKAAQERADLIALSNAEAMKTITLAIHAIVQKALVHILPAVAVILTGIAKLLDLINVTLGNSAGWLGLILSLTGDYIAAILIKYIPMIGKLFTGLKSIFSPIGEVLGKLGYGIGLIIGKIPIVGKVFLKVAGFFGKWLEPIGWIIVAFQLISNIFKEWNNFPKGFLGGLEAIGKALIDTILGPFIDAYHWIMKHFTAHSPSEIGLGIVQGLMAVEGMILRALLSPFTMAWELIKKIPFVSHLFGGKDLSMNVNPASNVDMSVGKAMDNINSTNINQPAPQSNPVDDMNDQLSKKISLVVNAINDLRADMKNGALKAVINWDNLTAVNFDKYQYRKQSFMNTI